MKMKEVQLNISCAEVEHAHRALVGIPGGAQRAIKSSLHRVGDGLKTDAVNETKRKYHLSPSEIRKHLFLKKANGANQSVSLTAFGNRKRIGDYRVTGQGKNLRVAVRANGMKRLRTGFVINKDGKKIVLWKPSGQDGPARTVFTASVPQLLANKETVRAIKKGASDRFQKRLDHEILRLMGACV